MPHEVIPYFAYSPYTGVHTIWYHYDFMRAILGRRHAVIEANRDGFISLAGLCANLAQDSMPDGNHVHLDPIVDMINKWGKRVWIGELELGSNASVVVMRDDRIAEDGSVFDKDHISSLGFMLPGRPEPLVWNQRFELWGNFDEKSEDVFQIDVPYKAWEDIKRSTVSLPHHCGLCIYNECNGEELAIAGTQRGLLLLTSIFVTIAQPMEPERATLTLKVFDDTENHSFKLTLKRLSQEEAQMTLGDA